MKQNYTVLQKGKWKLYGKYQLNYLNFHLILMLTTSTRNKDVIPNPSHPNSNTIK